MRVVTDGRGFSLLEVLVAVVILAGGFTGLLQLFTVTTAANVAARRSSLAAVMASAKMEELRRLPWPYAGSPPDALSRNTVAYCDLLDAAGRHLADCASPGDRAPFVRRWAVTPLPAAPGGTAALAVLVTWGDIPDVSAPGDSRTNEVRLVSLRAGGHR